MSNHQSKITKILDAWLDFFYLENLCRAQINAADDSNQIFDKGISIIGDNLGVDEFTFNPDFSQDPKKEGSKTRLLILCFFQAKKFMQFLCRHNYREIKFFVLKV